MAGMNNACVCVAQTQRERRRPARAPTAAVHEEAMTAGSRGQACTRDPRIPVLEPTPNKTTQ